MRRVLGLMLLALGGCESAPAPRGAPDAAIADALLDAAVPDAAPLDAAVPDAAPLDAAAPDAAPPDAACVPPSPPSPSGPLPRRDDAHRGVDATEVAAWTALREGLMADPDVHWVATYRHTTDDYLIAGGPPEARAEVRVQRVDSATDTTYAVVEGDLAAVFPSMDPLRHTDYDALLAASTPTGADLTAFGYGADDPRVAALEGAAQAWPLPVARIVQALEGSDAPDALAGGWPWAQGGVGTHGGLGLLQSRATFIVSGAAARRGVVLDAAAALVDVVPTVLAALGAETTAGVGPDGTYADGLYLTRQDGVVRWDALRPCETADHVVLVLFDGLLATEINHLALAPDPPVWLPTFRALAEAGTVFAGGAVAGFPSLSAPGHMTAGTGLWPGHHGMAGNAFWGRAEQAVLSPYSLLEDPALLSDADRLWGLYDRFTRDDIETLAQAVHRGLGPEAFAAVINEVSVAGADWSSVDHFLGAPKASVDTYRTVDRLAMVQLRGLLARPEQPVPTTLQLSFLATDGAGENWGPHAPGLRHEVLVELDRKLAQIRQLYADRGVLDRTLFVLVADHGMAMQRPPGVSIRTLVARTAVPVSYAGAGLIYLRTLDVAVSPTADGRRVQVRRHDDGAPVAGATVRCEGCAEARTDAEGVALVGAGGPITVEAERYFPTRLD